MSCIVSLLYQPIIECKQLVTLVVVIIGSWLILFSTPGRTLVDSSTENM